MNNNTIISTFKTLCLCTLFLCFCPNTMFFAVQSASAQSQYDQASGLDTQKQYSQALPLYESLAKQGHGEAQYKVGSYYYAGLGTSKDFTKAVFWLRKAVTQGHADAMVALGNCYYNGEGIFEVKKKALELYLMAAELGHAKGQLYTAILYQNNELYMRDMTQAVYWYYKASEQGLDDATVALGEIYLESEGVKKDTAKALEFFTMAAERGFVLAQERLGDLYKPKSKHEVTAERAMELFSKPSKTNDIFMAMAKEEAKRSGISLEEYFKIQFGELDDVPNDFGTSVMWYALALKQGSEHAKIMLSSMKLDYGKRDWKAYVERQAQKKVIKPIATLPKPKTQASKAQPAEAQAVKAQPVKPRAQTPSPSVQAIAPAPKKPGKAVLVPTSKDLLGLTAFTPDQKPDTCLQVMALHVSPLVGVRLESIRGMQASWKSKAVKSKAQGGLLIEHKGKILNAQDASFALDVSKGELLYVYVQDTGALKDTATRMRVVFFYEDGSRNYALLER